jgi:ABC-type lipoprotein release transport system permease subunit
MKRLLRTGAAVCLVGLGLGIAMPIGSAAPGPSVRSLHAAIAPPPGAQSNETLIIPDIDVSDRTAHQLGVRAGDFLEISSTAIGPWQRVRIAHVYQPVLYPAEVDAQSVDVRLHLPDLESLLHEGDAVDSIVVRLRDPGRAGEVAARLNTVAAGFRAYTSADLARRNSGTFEVVARFHRAISVVAILASGVFLMTIMTLRGEELHRQVGVMRLIGTSPRTVAATVALIATGIALLGSLLGIGLGYLLSAAINTYYRYAFDTRLVFSRITPPLLAAVGLISVLLGLAAGAMVAWRLLRQSPLRQLGR